MHELAAANERQQNEIQESFLNFEFFRDTWVGRLKIAELLFGLFAAAVVPATVNEYGAGFGFMRFVAWTAFICTLVDCFLHLIRDIWEKLVFVHDHPEIYLVLCALGTLGLCLGSIIVLAIAKYAEEPSMARASGFFGFFFMIALGIEAFLHFQSYKQTVEESREMQERSDTYTEEVFTGIA